ncbi:MAG: hypothetical protein QXD40_02785 [Desulfurococcaceae archaeon]
MPTLGFTDLGAPFHRCPCHRSPPVQAATNPVNISVSFTVSPLNVQTMWISSRLFIAYNSAGLIL